ncbi:MAG: aspartate-semialdehyde dehydrogenase [Bacteroidetes bacterium]|jgi:aspartate-semialdehyde dehydrogenase|nr:aspartate-semialdehyde dehydrogenase [Bacteroidota bacterium]MBT4401180.1 aspartate-semialdehyde dehydrogenase [Bacteroidota bacterium]MBT4412409.1 aspartate-semialdehyde dehydrogenase [Bacteroidota bacterium]MBT7092846.1 aspartate-semialdehyde dehydrogenase [Bacteroidota bacterium]MBT7466342.1 aspartate-semialdehyde dehydrogenase [Bacteroidota bacterium]
MKIAVVGATGLVGQKMLKVLEERNFPVSDLIPVASEKSVGKKVVFKAKEYTIVGLSTAVDMKPAIAIFSAGGQISLDWAHRFARNGTFVIDNSSAWRMDPNIPLVVPEINPDVIGKTDRIIANPNCSTIQLLVALAPLHKAFGIKRVVVSTYQSVTGTGVKAVQQLESEEQSLTNDSADAYPHPIHHNCLPHCDSFLDNGYTKEEMKLLNETRKILRDESIQLTATAVRVPVIGGHSESVNIELKNEFELAEVKALLAEAPGLTILDKPEDNLYPMPLNAHEKDEVFVGRIRKDNSCMNALNIWIVSDNLRKGAATNAVQIAEYLFIKKIVS